MISTIQLAGMGLIVKFTYMLIIRINFVNGYYPDRRGSVHQIHN